LNHCVTREHFSLAPIDFEQKPILIESLNERDVIVNLKIYFFLENLFYLLIRFFFFYVHNKIHIYMVEIQHYIHIYFILHHIYVHKVKKIGGKQRLNKRKRNSIKINYWKVYCFSPWSEFVDHLATIRLDDERINQYPPKIIILHTAKILFKTVN
jgi:hypothetical protein